jgi:hypothetical protein
MPSFPKQECFVYLNSFKKYHYANESFSRRSSVVAILTATIRSPGQVTRSNLKGGSVLHATWVLSPQTTFWKSDEMTLKLS